MKKHILLFVQLLALPAALWCKPIAALDSARNEVRIGWGDYLFESLVYHNTFTRNQYAYTGHLFGEYQYRLRDWLSVGGQVDYEQVMWTNRSGLTPQREYYCNIALLPAVRFTYYYHPWVTLYSALYTGLNINTGNTAIYTGQKTACAFAFGATLLGVQVGHNGWFGCVETGGLSALNNLHEIYMLDSRIFTVSVGHRF